MKNYNEKHLINLNEYTLIKDGKSHKILIQQSDYRIIIESRQYHLKIYSLKEFFKSSGHIFKSFKELYLYILDLFDRNKAYISSISNNFMKIILGTFEEKIELNLYFNNLIPDYISTPKNLTYDAFTYYNYANSFLIFNSVVNDRLYLVYTTQDKSIKVYDVLDEVQIFEILDSTEDNKQITNFRHFYDEFNRRDLIISIVGIKNNIKVWDALDWECLANIKDIYREGNIYSAILLNNFKDNNIFIITSNCTLFKNSQPLKIYDLKGNFIKEIPDSKGKTFLLDLFHDIRHSKIYIISVNKEFVKSFDFLSNECYKKYDDKSQEKKINFDGYFYSSVVNYFDDNNMIQLIVSGDDGFIRIWDFHEGNLIKKIETDKNCIFSLCLWNENYLFASSEDAKIKLIDLKAGVIIKELKGHNKMVCSLKKIIHKKLGECLVSQGFRKDQILIWFNKNES